MRRLAFGALAAALTIAAVLLGSRDEHAAEAPVPSAAPRVRPSPHTAPPPSTASLRRAARGFIAAFLAFEAGAEDPRTRGAIRRGADRHLALDLLADRPRKSGGRSTATLALRVTRLPHHPDLALVSGTAHRRSGPEPFAFLFARRAGRWLAIAPAE